MEPSFYTHVGAKPCLPPVLFEDDEEGLGKERAPIAAVRKIMAYKETHC